MAGAQSTRHFYSVTHNIVRGSVRSSHSGMCDVPVAYYIVGGISAQCMEFIVCSRVRFGRV